MRSSRVALFLVAISFIISVALIFFIGSKEVPYIIEIEIAEFIRSVFPSATYPIFNFFTNLGDKTKLPSVGVFLIPH